MILNNRGKAPSAIALSVVSFFLYVLLTSKATAGPCTREEAQKAEYGASTLRTWEEVFRSYQHYKSCDDGAISEGYSSSVASLLADKWNELGDLVKLIEMDRAFETFVLRHIDDTMSHNQDVMIESNIRRKCPKSASQLCMALSKRLSELDSAG